MKIRKELEASKDESSLVKGSARRDQRENLAELRDGDEIFWVTR